MQYCQWCSHFMFKIITKWSLVELCSILSLFMTLMPTAQIIMYPDRSHLVCTRPPFDSHYLHVFPLKYPFGGVIEK